MKVGFTIRDARDAEGNLTFVVYHRQLAFTAKTLSEAMQIAGRCARESGIAPETRWVVPLNLTGELENPADEQTITNIVIAGTAEEAERIALDGCRETYPGACIAGEVVRQRADGEGDE